MAKHSKHNAESSKSSLGNNSERKLDELMSFLQASIEGPNVGISSNEVSQTSKTKNLRAKLPTRQLLPTKHEMCIQQRQHRRSHLGQSSIDQQRDREEDLDVLYVEEP